MGARMKKLLNIKLILDSKKMVDKILVVCFWAVTVYSLITLLITLIGLGFGELQDAQIRFVLSGILRKIFSFWMLSSITIFALYYLANIYFNVTEKKD